MNPEMIIVFGILTLTVILFASDRLRLDVVALMAVLLLLLTGILTPAEALAGFSDPIVLIIAGLFIVGAGLFQTGVADALGQQLVRLAGTGEARLIVAIMLIVAFLSAFLSSTGTVAVFLPVVVSLAQRTGISPTKLLLPLAYASLIGGMLTLIRYAAQHCRQQSTPVRWHDALRLLFVHAGWRSDADDRNRIYGDSWASVAARTRPSIGCVT